MNPRRRRSVGLNGRGAQFLPIHLHKLLHSGYFGSDYSRQDIRIQGAMADAKLFSESVTARTKVRAQRH